MTNKEILLPEVKIEELKDGTYNVISEFFDEIAHFSDYNEALECWETWENDQRGVILSLEGVIKADDFYEKPYR